MLNVTGTIPIADLAATPVIVNLSTYNGVNKSSDLDDVTWNLDTILTSPDTSYVAKVNIDQMVFTNSFYNINKGKNFLRIVSTWQTSPTSGVSYEFHTLGSKPGYIEIEPGYYDADSLTNYLNDYVDSNVWVAEGSPVHYRGLGRYQFAETDAKFSKAFTWESSNAKIFIHSPIPDAYVGTGTYYDATHIYRGFYLVLDEITYPLMRQLGFLDLSISNTHLSGAVPVELGGTQLHCYGFSYVKHPNQDVILYGPNTSEDRYEAANVYDMRGPVALNVYMDNVGAGGRVGPGLNPSELLAVIPVQYGFGTTNTYKNSSVDKGSYDADFNLNRIRIRITDAITNEPVDFQGRDWVAVLLVNYIEVRNSEGAVTKMSLQNLYNGQLQGGLIAGPYDDRMQTGKRGRLF